MRNICGEDFIVQFIKSHEFNLHRSIDVWAFPIPESLLCHETLRIREGLILLLEGGIFKRKALLLWSWDLVLQIPRRKLTSPLFGGSTFIKYVCRSVEAEFSQRSEILILDLLSWQGKYSMVSLFYQSSQYYSCTCFSFLYFRIFKNFETIFQRQVIRFSFTFLKSIALFVSTIIAKFLKDLKTFALLFYVS